MAKISVTEDCGNAPKKQYIKDFCIANAKADIKTVMSMLSDEIKLEIPGYKSAQGKSDVATLLLHDSKRANVSELIIHNILSHGDRCAANGVIRFDDGGNVAFCNIYVFNSHSKDAKIKHISTYSIEIETGA